MCGPFIAQILWMSGKYIFSEFFTWTTTWLSSTIFQSCLQKSRFFSNGGRLGYLFWSLFSCLFHFKNVSVSMRWNSSGVSISFQSGLIGIVQKTASSLSSEELSAFTSSLTTPKFWNKLNLISLNYASVGNTHCGATAFGQPQDLINYLNKRKWLTAIAADPLSASKLLWAASALLKNSSIDVFSVIDIGWWPPRN